MSKPGAGYLRLPCNIGFAPAVNLGVRACTGEVIGLLNDDATAGPVGCPSAVAALRKSQWRR